MAIAWLAVGIAALIAEALTNAFFALFLAIGAAAAAVVSLFDVGLAGQILTAVMVGLVSALLGRPALMRAARRPSRHSLAAGAAMVGRTGRAEDHIGGFDAPGHVRIGGESWLAVTEARDGIDPGTPVTVLEVKGTTLVVWS